jgi:hypothetical protein
MHTGFFGKGLQERTKNRPFRNQAVLEAIKQVVPLKSKMIDVGASVGHFVRELRSVGYSIYGLDGSEGIEHLSGGLVLQCDLTKLPLYQTQHKSDWAIFLDVGEHIPRQFEDHVISVVSTIPSKGLIVSWADHVVPDRKVHNRRSDFYIANAFGLRGWELDEILTLQVREQAGDYVMMNKRLLVFTK